MKTKKEIISLLERSTPFVSIETIWEHDDDCKWGIESDELDEDDFQAWQSEVRATLIDQGKMYSGSGYLGGTWIKYGESPEQHDPDIGGFFQQKCVEALEDLCKQFCNNDLQVRKIKKAMKEIKNEE
jgi:hypothetical protein